MTPLVKGELINWALDAVSILGVTAALLTAWRRSAHGMTTATGFAAPIIAVTLVVLTIYTPYKLALRSVHELLGRRAAGSDADAVEQACRGALDRLGIKGAGVAIIRVGRLHRVIVSRPDADAVMGSSIGSDVKRLLSSDSNSSEVQIVVPLEVK